MQQCEEKSVTKEEQIRHLYILKYTLEKILDNKAYEEDTPIDEPDSNTLVNYLNVLNTIDDLLSGLNDIDEYSQYVQVDEDGEKSHS